MKMKKEWDTMTNSFDTFAEDYDEDIYPMGEPEFILPTVAALEKLAPGKDILAFAVGTGRIAIPLAQKGFKVSGIDISEEMLKVMANKKDGHLVESFVGDMSTIALNRTFDLVYNIMNGITYLLTLDEQVAFFKNAAKHLKPGGVLVLETFLPRLDRIVKDDVAPYALEETYIGFDKFDQNKQLLTSYQFDLSGEKVDSFQTKHRYVWPSELELMGKLADMKVLYRYENWEGDPLTNESDNIVMVLQKEE